MNIKATNIELTDEVRAYVEKKIGELDKFIVSFGSATQVKVEVGRTTFHHQSGDIFRAEVNLSLPGTLLRAEREAGDLFSAIDSVRDEIIREVKKYKDKNRTKERKLDQAEDISDDLV